MENKANLSGKIKRIIEIDSFQSGITKYEFTFIYDSTNGLLKTVQLNNQDFVRIDYSIPNKIQIIYKKSLIGFTPSTATVNAYIDNNNYINRLTYTDSLNPIESSNLLIYNNINNKPDSIREYTFPSFYDYSYYTDFIYSNTNVTKYIHRYSSLFIGENIDTIYSYHTNFNFQNLPLQENQFNIYSGYATRATNPSFLMELNQIQTSLNSAKLIDSVAVINTNTAHTSRYYYTFDVSNRVTNLVINGNLFRFTFMVSYY